jgi:hypothetical protein
MNPHTPVPLWKFAAALAIGAVVWIGPAHSRLLEAVLGICCCWIAAFTDQQELRARLRIRPRWRWWLGWLIAFLPGPLMPAAFFAIGVFTISLALAGSSLPR